jgi:speckle-type POZ protein
VKTFPGLRGWGAAKFFKREVFEKSRYLKGDSFTIRCDIVVIDEIRTEVAKTSGTSFVSVPQSNLSQHLGDLLDTGKGADVVFEVGGETFTAHRWLLAARSPVFSAELFGSMKEGDAARAVRIDDMEAQVFKALLRFLYTDSLPETETQEGEEDVMCQHLLVAADRYSMERLKLICEEKLCEYIDVATVATILALAEQHRCVGLKKACFDFLSCPANRRAVLATEGFQHVYRSCPSVVMELITMPSRP